jgi:hypothetical protein
MQFDSFLAATNVLQLASTVLRHALLLRCSNLRTRRGAISHSLFIRMRAELGMLRIEVGWIAAPIGLRRALCGNGSQTVLGLSADVAESGHRVSQR